MQRLAASRADGRDEDTPQGVYGCVAVAQAAGKLEEVLDLYASSEDRGLELTRQKAFQSHAEWRGVGWEGPLVNWNAKNAAALCR